MLLKPTVIINICLQDYSVIPIEASGVNFGQDEDKLLT